MRTVLAYPDDGDDDPRDIHLTGIDGTSWHLTAGGGGSGVALPIPFDLVLPAAAAIYVGAGGPGGQRPPRVWRPPSRAALIRRAFQRFTRDIRAALRARPAL